MVRLANDAALRDHLARFDPSRLTREGLDPLEARRLDALLDRPYEDLDGRDVAHALALVRSAGLPTDLFAYFLPAVLRRPPWKDVRASECLMAGLLAARDDAVVASWDAEIEATLVRFLTARPLRGGDDPVDLWFTETASRQRGLEAARRLPWGARRRAGLLADWARATEGPVYARAALVLLQRWPSAAERRFLLWETGSEDNLLRAWVEVMFHAHGEGWRPGSAALDAVLDAPSRYALAEGLIGHLEPDVAIGAAAVALLLAPGRGREVRARVAPRIADLDATDQDRFVLLPVVRSLLTGR
jgi:hypothetical protein